MPVDPKASDGSSYNYNTVFERLVDDINDGRSQVVGIIAYGMYKISKREWITEHREQVGAAPGDDDMRKFALAQTNTNLDGYRAQAEQILASYAEALLAEERPKIIKDALRGTFWSSVWSSIVATFIFSIILICMVIIAEKLGFGVPIQISIPK